MSAILEISGLTKRFVSRGRDVTAVDDVSLTLAPGETLAIAGASGSGKTTLARIVMRLVEPDAGVVAFEGRNLLALRGTALRAIRSRFQMVFQDPQAAFNPRATVSSALTDPLRLHAVVPRQGEATRIAELLDQVRLPHALAGRHVHELSGGQRQRVAIARAIATSPSLLVLDEPASALDVSVRGQVLNLLIDLQAATRMAYLFISHDLGVVAALAHRVAVMEAGRIVEQGPARQVLSAPSSSAAQALVAAVPKLKLEGAE